MVNLKRWFVYMIHCSDGTLYTGITTDLERRFQDHLNLRGAKYFRGRIPLKIIYQEAEHTRSSASKQEIQIKRLSRQDKWRLADFCPNENP